jgi:hypothetical protein
LNVVADVRCAFEHYEQALREHNIERLNDFFLPSADTVRFGISEQNYGIDAIRTYRRASAAVHPQRRLQHTVILALSDEIACVSTEFTDPVNVGVGRQSQTWVRTGEGWKIAMAHVSLPAPPLGMRTAHGAPDPTATQGELRPGKL